MRARLVSDATGSDGHLDPLVGFRVALIGPRSLFGNDELSSAIVQPDGHFEFIDYRRDPSNVGDHRTLELVAYDPIGREIPFSGGHVVGDQFKLEESGRITFQDVSDEQIITGDFIVREADARGFLVTLGTGETRFFSTGNRVKLLMDQDAFAYAAMLFRGAQDSILMSQLFFALPSGLRDDGKPQETKLVFDFDPAAVATQPRAIGEHDSRPERLLMDAADRQVDIRVLLHAFKIPLFIKIIAGALIFPFAGSDGVYWVTGELLGADFTDQDEVERYFKDKGHPGIKVKKFEQPVLSAGVMHAKLMVVDGRQAVSIGSPFGQSYVDTHDHRIEAWTRGDSDGFPKHDAGFAVSGPALLDIYRTLKLLWDTTAPDDKLPDLPGLNDPPRVHTGPPLSMENEDGVCAMQIVRTLTAGRFDNPSDGEKGILEAYLRAIANAKDFVYLETQYFTNDAIGHALVEAMKRNTDLQVIVALNIQPDVPFYPFKQRRLITRIRKGIGQTASGPQRFGVFTRWSHEVGQPRPQMLPIYIHAKAGIVDNAWATVGSANLDGLSLDSSLPSQILHSLFNTREQRAVEVNGIMLNTESDSTQVVDILRRKLWAEHLGYVSAQGEPDITAADLTTRPAGGWLKLWSDRAAATLQQLRNNPTQPLTNMARVLPWPTDDSTHKTPRDHLNALGIHTYAVVPLKSTRAFDFDTGDWKKGSAAKMDYP
ncbi:MAG: phospholipase D-like domain-containing protein [Anaerolineae bacterium]